MRSKKSPFVSLKDDDRLTATNEPQQTEDRAGRLARLKLALDSGTYEISAHDVADKIIAKLRNESAKT